MSEQRTITCPHCGFGKDVPRHSLPPEGTRTLCPRCRGSFLLSISPLPRQQSGDRPVEPPPVRTDVALRVNIGFKTYTARDNRFRGKGVVRITGDQIEITARRRSLFSLARRSEVFPLSAVRNLSRSGRVVSFVLPLEKGCWQALLVCYDERTAERLEARLPRLRDSSLSSLRAARLELKQRLEELPGGTPVVWTLLALNSIVYALLALSGAEWSSLAASRLKEVGGNFSPLTTSGEWWRMLSYSFLHSGCVHLAANMVALCIFGRLAERIYGSWAFLCIYLLSALAGAAGSLVASPTAISVGASGAVFGVLGAVISFLATDRQLLTRGARRQLLTAVVAYGCYTLVNGFRSSGIDNAAHVGGLAAGLLLGWATEIPPRLLGTGVRWITGSVGLGIVLVIAGTAFTVAVAPRPGPEYRTLESMIALTREIGEREKRLAEQGKSLAEKGPAADTAEAGEYARRHVRTYEELDEKLNALRPTKQGLHARQALLGRYLELKREGWTLFARALEIQDEMLLQQARDKIVEANGMAAEIGKPVDWFR